ncbi:MAG: 4-hydroxy-2-oxovalerate aldolase [Candidatus Ancillula sp.]|nr:4-hydroxy-2-oxovalerate aldolase [Candidatus Ancillula sp.]
MTNLKFFDSTLRDGSHAIKQQLKHEHIEKYCNAVSGAGFYTTVVGHGYGLGASTIQCGQCLLSDEEMLETARKNLLDGRVGAFMNPGYGTIEDDLIPAIEAGAELFCIASHVTEANITRQHIEFLADKKQDVYGVLTMFHTTPTANLITECKKMQEYGANGVILMDSAGAATLEMTKRTISELRNALNIEIGFHAHNNLGMAVGNTLEMIANGATIIDGCLRGFGAGAGNLQLESLIAILEKSGVETGVNLMQILRASFEIMPEIQEKEVGIDPISVYMGIQGVLSAYKLLILRLCDRLNIDAFELIREVGQKNLVACQEDVVIEVANRLKNKRTSSIADRELSL